MRPIDADKLKADLIEMGFLPAIVNRAIDDAPTVNSCEWISVTERLPEPNNRKRERKICRMKKFEEMTDQELIDFCHINMLDIKVCEALGCEELCKEQDCPMYQLLNRFEQHIKAHQTEKGGE